MPPYASTTLTHLTPLHHQRLACATRVDFPPSFAAPNENLHVSVSSLACLKIHIQRSAATGRCKCCCCYFQLFVLLFNFVHLFFSIYISLLFALCSFIFSSCSLCFLLFFIFEILEIGSLLLLLLVLLLCCCW